MVFYGELAERLVSHFLLQSQAALIVIPISHCTGDGSFAYHRPETEQTDCLSDIPQSAGNCSILTGLCVRK